MTDPELGEALVDSEGNLAFVVCTDGHPTIVTMRVNSTEPEMAPYYRGPWNAASGASVARVAAKRPDMLTALIAAAIRTAANLAYPA